MIVLVYFDPIVGVTVSQQASCQEQWAKVRIGSEITGAYMRNMCMTGNEDIQVVGDQVAEVKYEWKQLREVVLKRNRIEMKRNRMK